MTTIADQIIQGHLPDLEAYLAQGGAINDIDEYGFTFLIESAISSNLPAMKLLINAGADVNKQDVTGRTPLQWVVDSNQIEQAKILLEAGADPNIPNRAGQSPLVFPLLREQWAIKQLLYEYGASLSFGLDFINTKLLGHRFEITGTVDIVNAKGAFIELDYEGFYLEFTLAGIQNSLSRFGSNFAFRELRLAYTELGEIIDAFYHANQLIQYQDSRTRTANFQSDIHTLFTSPLLILPVAYQGHAITFVKYGRFFAKCDRGENSLKEGSVNIYWIGNMNMWTTTLLKTLLYQKQNKVFVHQQINQVLGLKPIGKIPLSHQKAGNCSWANVEATVPSAYVLIQLVKLKTFDEAIFQEIVGSGMRLYTKWLAWDKDRALEECIQSFYDSDPLRKASKAAILGAVLFQGCHYPHKEDMHRAEKILKILTLPDYKYVLQSYINVYCEKRLSVLGNNLLKILDDFGIDKDNI
jgi:hypothetical protein